MQHLTLSKYLHKQLEACLPDEVVAAVPNNPVPVDLAAEPNPKPVVPKPVDDVVAVPNPPNKLLAVVLVALPKLPKRLPEAVDVVFDPKEPKPTI